MALPGSLLVDFMGLGVYDLTTGRDGMAFARLLEGFYDA